MPVCPQGHNSSTSDYCDTCGIPMGLIAPPPAPKGPKLVKACPNCGVDSPANALFCESCGYDFITGVSPEPYAPAPTLRPAPRPEPETPAEVASRSDALEAPSAPAPKPEPEPAPVVPTPSRPRPVPTPEPQPEPDSEALAEVASRSDALEAPSEPLSEPEPTPLPDSGDFGTDNGADVANVDDEDVPAPDLSIEADHFSEPDPAEQVPESESVVEPEADPESSAEVASRSDALEAAEPDPVVEPEPEFVVEPEPEPAPVIRLEPPDPVDVRAEPPRQTLEERIASTPPPAPQVVRRSTEPLDPSWGQWVAEVWIDPEWHAAQESAEPIPSPGPPRVIELRRKSSLIGRPSPQRDIYPEIDCDPDTGVSRQQAELLTDGIRWFVRDLNSSNGTYVGRVDSPLPAMPIKGRRELGPDDRVYVGTWTRIVVRPAIRGELG